MCGSDLTLHIFPLTILAGHPTQVLQNGKVPVCVRCNSSVRSSRGTLQIEKWDSKYSSAFPKSLAKPRERSVCGVPVDCNARLTPQRTPMKLWFTAHTGPRRACCACQVCSLWRKESAPQSHKRYPCRPTMFFNTLCHCHDLNFRFWSLKELEHSVDSTVNLPN